MGRRRTGRQGWGVVEYRGGAWWLRHHVTGPDGRRSRPRIRLRATNRVDAEAERAALAALGALPNSRPNVPLIAGRGSPRCPTCGAHLAELLN